MPFLSTAHVLLRRSQLCPESRARSIDSAIARPRARSATPRPPSAARTPTRRRAAVSASDRTSASPSRRLAAAPWCHARCDRPRARLSPLAAVGSHADSPPHARAMHARPGHSPRLARSRLMPMRRRRRGVMAARVLLCCPACATARRRRSSLDRKQDIRSTSRTRRHAERALLAVAAHSTCPLATAHRDGLTRRRSRPDRTGAALVASYPAARAQHAHGSRRPLACRVRSLHGVRRDGHASHGRGCAWDASLVVIACV